MKRSYPSPFTLSPSPPLDVLNIHHFIFPHPTRSLHFGDIAAVFADQRARNRRADGNLALPDICLVIADDLIGDDVAVVGVFKYHGRTEHAAAIRIDRK